MIGGVEAVWASLAGWFTPTVLFCLLNLIVGTIFIASRFKTTHRTHTQHREHQQHDREHDSHHQLVRAPSMLLERFRSINFSLYNYEQHEPSETQYVDSPPVQPARAPSFLERVTSIKFSTHLSEEPEIFSPETHNSESLTEVHTQTQFARAPSLLERVKSIKFPIYSSEQSYQDTSQESQPEPRTELIRTPSSLLERIKSIKFSLPKHDQSDTINDQDTKPEADTRMSEHDDRDHYVTRIKSDTRRQPAKIIKSEKMKRSTSEKQASTVEKEEDVYLQLPATVREPKGKWSREALFGGEDQEVDAKADDFINRFKQQLKLQRLDSLLKSRKSRLPCSKE